MCIRDRILNTPGYNVDYTGQVWAVDMKSGRVEALSPEGMEHAARFAAIDKTCYDPTRDLLLVGTYLRDGGGHTPVSYTHLTLAASDLGEISGVAGQ